MAWYDDHADSVAQRYESVDPESLYAWLIDLLPEPPARILDIGAGSSRDAAWLAAKGYDTFAAEPSKQMRDAAQKLHPSAPVRWIPDALPQLTRTSAPGVSFNAILLHAVWMHVASADRTRAFRKMVNLLEPGGLLAGSLRHGPADPARGMHSVDSHDIVRLARNHGMLIQSSKEAPDQIGRREVTWSSYALRLPDDGTGALPLLRHIILNDTKTSTYKLGLLRSLCRIAESASGMFRRSADDHYLSVPLGLVALVWIRLYKPLIEADCPQSPENRGAELLSFVKQPFRAIGNVSSLDLRVGQRFRGLTAIALHGAIRDAAATIRKMPAHYTTYADGRPILPVRHATARKHGSDLLLDEAYLRSFGELLVPRRIWQVLQRHSVWIEPAIIEEWLRLMQKFATSQGRSLDRSRVAAAMTWSDPDRDVRLARQRADTLLAHGKLHCVWSGKALSTGSLNVDHCFPWSVWPCSDLWNLLPSSGRVNQHEKRAQLPGQQLMRAAQDRIISWWESAYPAADPGLHERFVHEAASTLPGIQPATLDVGELFQGVLSQRDRLRHDQQVPEWQGKQYL